MKGHDHRIDRDVDDYTREGPRCKTCEASLTAREIKDEATICDECELKREETEPPKP